jgi:glycosyltransferase involved in cell wall biosynthesis
MRVGILTTFYEATSGFSLIAVAETQIRMLMDGGYDPVVLVQENFKSPDPPSIWRPEMVDLRPAIPFMHLTPQVTDDYEERVASILTALQMTLQDVTCCITHDIALQPIYKEHAAAVNRYAKERPDLLWLHSIHSCPMGGNYPSLPGYILYPNDSDKALVVKAYGLQGQEHRVKVSRASHSIDPLLISCYDSLTKSLVTKSDLLGGEVVAIYPVRLDKGKQPEKIIRLMAGVKKAGYKPRLLIVDWQSMGDRFQKYIDELQRLAVDLNVGREVNFSSRLDDTCNNGVPRQVVMELMSLTNVYIHPSRVETYSLVVHEALLAGNLLVLNYDFPAMRELFGDNAIFMDFGSDRATRTYQPDEQTFWDEEARRLIAELKSNRALWGKTVARRDWTPQAMARDFLPLLHLEPV